AAGYPLYSIYCPGISSASLARLYGVGFVLESIKAPGLRAPGPKGAVFVTQVGKTEDLFRIRGAAAATLTPMPSKGRLPGLNAPGRPVPVTHPDPSSWKLVIKASSSQVLRLRLTDVPGWRATIDGRPLALKQFAGIMLQAEVPAGTHTVELRYWPATFSAGLLLAAGAVVGLVVASMIPRLRRRSRSRSSRGRLDPTQPP
ncbi:MAG TPA: YfhO family protein, partial [Acidimicrobiales bacterium]|nr:YfhO family protein [Acidimicrobiales bacterium]